MSHFYSYIEGDRGPATRCGSKSSGITATAQSWEGSITVNMHYNYEEDCNYFSIQARTDSGVGGRTFFHGRVKDFVSSD